MQALKRARLYNRGHVLKKQCQSSFTTFIISVLSYLIFIKSYVTLPKFMCLVKWWQKRWSRKTFQHSAQTGWWVYRVQAGTLQETQVKKNKIFLYGLWGQCHVQTEKGPSPNCSHRAGDPCCLKYHFIGVQAQKNNKKTAPVQKYANMAVHILSSCIVFCNIIFQCDVFNSDKTMI